MSYALVRARLDEACVPLPVPSTEEGYVPIGRSFPWPTLAIACGWRPSHVGDSVLPAVLRRAGIRSLPTGDIAAAMLPLVPVPEGIDVLGRLLTMDQEGFSRRGDGDAEQRTSFLWQFARWTEPGSPRVRRTLAQSLHGSGPNLVESLTGLLVLGLDAADVPAVVQTMGHRELAVALTALAVLAEHGFLAGALDDGSLDAAIGGSRHVQVLGRAVEAVVQDNLVAMIDVFDATGAVWAQRLAAALVLGTIALRTADPSMVFDLLESRVVDEDDSDATTGMVWALANAAGRLGETGARLLLRLARMTKEGSWQQASLLLALCEIDIDDDDARESLLAEVDAFTTEDPDTRDARALAGAALDRGRALPWCNVFRWQGVRAWLLHPWQRPDGFWRTLALPPTIDAVFLGAVVGATLSERVRAGMLGWTLAQSGVLAPLVEAVANERHDACSDLARVALLLWPGPVTTDPVVARVALGPEAGAPLPDTPETWGRLLRCMQENRLQEHASALLKMCPMGVRVAEGWFRAEMLFERGSSKTDAERALAGWSRTPPVWQQRQEPTTLDRLRVGLAVPASALFLALDAVTGVQRLALVTELLHTTDDRDVLLRLAQRVEAEGLSAGAVGRAWRHLEASENWILREAAAVLALHAPAEHLGDPVMERLVALANDDDSDVRREARAACGRFGLAWDTGADPNAAAADAGDLPF